MLEKPFEDFLLFVLWYANPTVFHLDLKKFCLRLLLNSKYNSYRAVLRSELKRIRKQIEKDLLELVLVEQSFQFLNGGLKREMDILLF